MRDAPSLSIVAGLQDAGAKVRAYDPEGIEQARFLLTDVVFTNDAYTCAEGADALVIATEWNAFRALDFERLRKIMAAPVIIDLRNVYCREEVERHGFRYASVGTAEAITSDD